MNVHRTIKILRTSVTVILLVFVAYQTVAAVGVPKMSKEDLKGMLGNKDLVIVDVRLGRDWKSSEFKIKGAVREHPREIDQWAPGYAKDKTYVFYCA